MTDLHVRWLRAKLWLCGWVIGEASTIARDTRARLDEIEARG